MAIFKCKMCGGTLEVRQNAETVTCEYCGTTQTLPKMDGEKKLRLYERAEAFRRNQEFDKAMSIYLQVLSEDDTDAESYWAIVLCRYGIEYVEDPSSHKRVPTVNRVQFTPVTADEDYKLALRYATEAQRVIYEKEAEAIDNLQREILAISEKEEPFDVFICYKETDNHGRRTPDSVLAMELYHELVEEGLKVFFSRITLEDKIGTAYEPYIFAALHSAKVMVALGTTKAHFEAPWVRNEWARYLALIKNGEKKTLIPAYKGMDPYDLPEEFSNLQAQDMEKLGFMQDLIHGIQKITDKEESEEKLRGNEDKDRTVRIEPLLERVDIFLEDADWESADAYCERVLDQDPKNAKAYLGKLLAELQLHKVKELLDCKEEYTNRRTYERVKQFADEDLKKVLNEYELQRIYNDGVFLLENAETKKECEMASEYFQAIPGYKDADQLLTACEEKIEELRKDAIYKEAVFNMNQIGTTNKIKSLSTAESLFLRVPGWKDADALAAKCRQKKEEIWEEERSAKEQAEIEAAERRRRMKKILPIIVIILIGYFAVNEGIKLLHYQNAVDKMEQQQYVEAMAILEDLDGFKDSEELLEEINGELSRQGEIEEMIPTSLKDWQLTDLKTAGVGDVVEFGHYEQDNDTSNGKEKIRWKVVHVDESCLYLVSEYCLDCQPYNEKGTNSNWSVSSLKEWLENDFLETAFSKKEQEKLVEVTNNAKEFNTKTNSTILSAATTSDIVYLLSVDEMRVIYSIDWIGQCKATEYARQQGCPVNDMTGYCEWWTRTRARFSSGVAVIPSTVYHAFSAVENGKALGIRPMIVVNASLLE